MDEEFEQMFRDLDKEGLSPGMLERKRGQLERRREQRHEALEQEFRALDEEMQQFWANRQRGEMDRQQQEWEADQQQRRDEEGEHFDEEAFEFERSHMQRRRELEERRISIDEEFEEMWRELDQEDLPHQMAEAKRRLLERRQQDAHEELEEEFRVLDDEMQQYWADRSRREMDRHFQEWEEEQQRRRDEEGEHFDEEAYEFERGMMDRRRELEERRIGLNEQFEEMWRELDHEDLPHQMAERKRRTVERRQQQAHEEIDREVHALEEEMQRYWEDKHGGEMDPEGEWDEQGHDGDGQDHHDVDGQGQHDDDGEGQHDEDHDGDGGQPEGDWPWGPNSVRLVVVSVDEEQVVVEVHVAESDPIGGWKGQLNFDSDDLEFADYKPGGFIKGFMPLFLENDRGVEVGGGRLGDGDMSQGEGVLAVVRLNIVGDLPAKISLSDVFLEGETGDEFNFDNRPVIVE